MEIANDLPKSAKGSRKDRAILALLQNASVPKAAEAVEIHPSTLWRWLKEPEFQRKLLEAQSAAFSQSMRCLQQAAPAAASALVRTLRDPATPAHTRVRAAESVLKVCQETLQHAVLDQRVAEIEKPRSEAEPPPTRAGACKPNLLVLVPLLFLLLPFLPWLAAQVLAPPTRSSFASLGMPGPWTDWNHVSAELRPSTFQAGGTIHAEPVFLAEPLPGIAPAALATTSPQPLLMLLPKCEAGVWHSHTWEGTTVPVPNEYDREPCMMFSRSVAKTRKTTQDSPAHKQILSGVLLRRYLALTLASCRSVVESRIGCWTLQATRGTPTFHPTIASWRTAPISRGGLGFTSEPSHCRGGNGRSRPLADTNRDGGAMGAFLERRKIEEEPVESPGGEKFNEYHYLSTWSPVSSPVPVSKTVIMLGRTIL
jgi:hypothetical protein